MSSTTMKYKPRRGEIVVVPSIPPCDFCAEPKDPGIYDFATRMGPWANGCEAHWKLYRASAELGVGTGQLWITDDQIDYSDETPLQTAKRELRRG